MFIDNLFHVYFSFMIKFLSLCYYQFADLVASYYENFRKLATVTEI